MYSMLRSAALYNVGALYAVGPTTGTCLFQFPHSMLLLLLRLFEYSVYRAVSQALNPSSSLNTALTATASLV